MKKVFIGLASLFALSIHSELSYAETTPGEITVIVDGTTQQYDQLPILQNNTTFIPIRGVATTTGSEVEWEQKSQMVILKKTGSEISFNVGSLKGFINGKEIDMPESFVAKSNRTMVPLRFASEKLGLTVNWDQSTNTVHIIKPVLEVPQPPVEPIKETIDKNLDIIANVILNGYKYIGTPYLYGASAYTTAYFDCSSFIQRIFGESGISLPRTSREQSKMGTPVLRTNLQKGDLVFFDTEGKGNITHVSVYIDANTLFHATSSKGVNYTTFSKYWQDKYITATRIVQSKN